MADSRPAPGPVTRTSTERTPFSLACSAQFAAASCAAKGVPLRDPLKPIRPADNHARTFPSWSAIAMIVLLKEACTVAIACGMFFFSFFPPRGFLPFRAGAFSGAAAAAGASAMVPFYPRSGRDPSPLMDCGGCRPAGPVPANLLLGRLLLAGDRLT